MQPVFAELIQRLVVMLSALINMCLLLTDCQVCALRFVSGVTAAANASQQAKLGYAIGKNLLCTVRHAMCFAGAFCNAEHVWQLQTLECCMFVKPAADAEAICHYHHCAYMVLHLCSDHWIVSKICCDRCTTDQANLVVNLGSPS